MGIIIILQMRKLRVESSSNWQVSYLGSGKGVQRQQPCFQHRVLDYFHQGSPALGSWGCTRSQAAQPEAMPHLYFQLLPSLALAAELRLLSDQQQHNKCNELESPLAWSMDK